MDLLVVRLCCGAHDGRDVFSSVLLPCLFMFRGQRVALLECRQRGKRDEARHESQTARTVVCSERRMIYSSELNIKGQTASAPLIEDLRYPLTLTPASRLMPAVHL